MLFRIPIQNSDYFKDKYQSRCFLPSILLPIEKIVKFLPQTVNQNLKMKNCKKFCCRRYCMGPLGWSSLS